MDHDVRIKELELRLKCVNSMYDLSSASEDKLEQTVREQKVIIEHLRVTLIKIAEAIKEYQDEC